MEFKEIDFWFIGFAIVAFLGFSNILNGLLMLAIIPFALFFCTPIWIFYLVRWAIREIKS